MRLNGSAPIWQRRPQFSLAALLSVVSLACLWLGNESRRVDRQREAVSVIDRLHGTVSFSDWGNAGGKRPRATSARMIAERLRGAIGEEHLRSIHEVDISFNPYVIDADVAMRASDDDLRVICAAGSVRRLTLDGAAVTDAGVASLISLTSLECLHLCNRVTQPQLVASMLLRRLGGRFATSTAICVWGYESGARGKPPQPSGTMPCESSPRIPEMETVPVECMWQFAGPLITDKGLRDIAALNSLLELRLDGTRVTDTGVKYLAALRNLEHLSLAETAVGDEAFAVACRLPKLRTLDFCGTKITDAALVHLRQLPSRVRVRLGDTAVTQRGVDHLLKELSAAKQTIPIIDLTPRYRKTPSAKSG